MCTLVAALGVREDFPLVLAFNRDERLDRPSGPPRVLQDRPRVVGPIDLQQGGTWFGVTETGYVTGVLNRREGRPHDPSKRSRGRLVLDLLLEGRAPGGHADEYNPYWLVFGTHHALWVSTGGAAGARCSPELLGAGLHVLVSGPDESVLAARRAHVPDRLANALRGPWDALVGTLRAVLAEHTPPVCVHTPLYGTRSSTIVAIEPGRVARYLHAEGPPCEARYEDVTSLLQPARISTERNSPKN